MSVTTYAFKLEWWLGRKGPLSGEAMETFEKTFNPSWEKNLWGKNLRARGGVATTVHIHLILECKAKKGSQEQTNNWCQVIHSSEWKRTVSHTQCQLLQNLPTNVTGPQKILLWPSNLNVPKFNQYFRYCYNASQSSICLDQIMLRLTSDGTESMYPKTRRGLRHPLVQSLHLTAENVETCGGKVTFIQWLITISDRSGPKGNTEIFIMICYFVEVV